MKRLFFICACFLCFFSIGAADIKVYPNPWIPEADVSYEQQGDTRKHGGLSADGWIKFSGMQQNTGELRIYDVVGNLVRKIYWDADAEAQNFPTLYNSQEYKDVQSGIKIIHWDGKNNYYNYVESGVYIWILTETGGKKYNGKIVIVR